MPRLAHNFFAVLTVFAVAGACSPSRVAESTRVLADIGAGEGPSSLKEITPRPRRETVGFAVEGRRHVGDLYTPPSPLAGLVLVPGLAPAGKDDRRLVAFATSLARARFRVLVPDLPGMRALRVSSGDARVIADAAIHLGSLDPQRPLGMTAISFAAGPMVGALFEPGVADRVDFMISVGGYYDLESVISFFTTGYFRTGPDAAWRYRRPNVYGKWVFVLSNARGLDDPGDRIALMTMAERRVDDENADISDLAGGLGPQGRAVYALLTNRDPNRVPELLAALPPAVTAEITALDPKRRDLGALNVRFVLVHGRDDPIIPETESMAFAEAVPPGQAELYLLDSFPHADAGELSVSDKLTLLGAVYTVLGFRDGGRGEHRRLQAAIDELDNLDDLRLRDREVGVADGQ